MVPDSSIFHASCAKSLELGVGDSEEHACLLAGYFRTVGVQVRTLQRGFPAAVIVPSCACLFGGGG